MVKLSLPFNPASGSSFVLRLSLSLISRLAGTKHTRSNERGSASFGQASRSVVITPRRL
jgi:hypothetical protein